MSFARAADELCVTPGAVSQHVRALERRARHRAVPAQARSIELTAAGARYLPPIRDAFELISEATETNAPALRGLKFRVGDRVRRAESGLSRGAAVARRARPAD
jgi:LysR family glycine cleavage system transcriptional activator